MELFTRATVSCRAKAHTAPKLMVTNRQLKIDLLKEQNQYTRNIEQIVQALSAADPNASILSLEKAVASRSLVKKLWDLLPNEQESHVFITVEDQTNKGRALLPASNFSLPVTLHLGWDILAFSCTLEAAWHTWQKFSTLIGTETFNCCIYPDSLEWYVVRAGGNLYPMVFTGTQYALEDRKP
jgi:hypothetical protein